MSFGSADRGTALAALDLSRSLTVQWAVVGTKEFAVATGAFGALYQSITGRTATYDFAPARTTGPESGSSAGGLTVRAICR